ncbi:hypothetical protein [Vibrio sp. B1ASS3]|uniref:hypothetical protein n=1 Tax=Vibrio sp. B1ASS3 TaxID=2751176 RepID=UPI001ABA51A7|nr:hypothetical protein [Vibrio sp. B1ASS3]
MTEVNYLLEHVCFGDAIEANELVLTFYNEILKLGNNTCFKSDFFVLQDEMQRSLHKLTGSSGLMGLNSLSCYIKTITYTDDYVINYYLYKKSTKAILSYLQDILLILRK